jgi:hypothetical protein
VQPYGRRVNLVQANVFGLGSSDCSGTEASRVFGNQTSPACRPPVQDFGWLTDAEVDVSLELRYVRERWLHLAAHPAGSKFLTGRS